MDSEVERDKPEAATKHLGASNKSLLAKKSGTAPAEHTTTIQSKAEPVRQCTMQ